MASPVFAAAGSASASQGGNPTPGFPTGISSGSLLLLHVLTSDNAVPTTPSGWTSIVAASLWGGRSTVFAKSANGTESGTLTIVSNVGATALAFARIYRFEGWLNDATITNNFEGFSTSNNSSSPITDAGVTTLGVDRLAVQFVHVGNDVALASFTGETGGDWTEAVAEATTTVASDGTLQLQTASLASAGTIDGGSTSFSPTSAGWGIHGFAIKPAALANAAAEVSFAEVEAPFAPAAAELSWSEVEVPFAPANAELSWAEIEFPFAPASAEISVAEVEAPFVNASAEVSWSEVEVPFVSASAELSWAEIEAPFAQAQSEIGWAEVEVPLTPASAEVSWAEVEVPELGAVSDESIERRSRRFRRRPLGG